MADVIHKAAEPEESETAAAAPATLAGTPSPATPARPAAPAAASAGTREAALAELVAAGGQFLEKLCAALAAGGGAAGAPDASSGPAPGGEALIERDERTGRSYLRLPLPGADVLERLAGLLSGAVAKR